MVKWYRVAYLCPICRKDHDVSLQRRIDHGPHQSGTVAELYPSGELPWSLADLMRDSVVCEATGELVKLNDPARLQIEPWPVRIIA